MNRASSDPPNPNPTRIALAVFWKIMMMTVAPISPRPTVYMPATPPVRNATFNAPAREPVRAAAAVRTLPRTARLIPMNPVRPDRNAPATNAVVRNAPDAPNDNAVAPPGLSTSVEERKTSPATGTRMNAMVRNWRRRYAIAPSWIAVAISCIFGVP